MRMMERKMRVDGILAAVLVCAMMSLSLVGCGGGDGTDTDNNGSGNSSGGTGSGGGGTGDGGGTGGGGNTTPQTPISADFNIENMEQWFLCGITAVTITPKADKSGGAITVYYEGTSYLKSISLPQAAGSYVVTFDVAPTTGWNAASGLNAGTLTITDYNFGDTGPGGGKIFYRSETGFTMTDTNEICHYLEAAPVTGGSHGWSSSDYDNTSITGTGTAIGTGRKNTAVILAKDVNAPAALTCNNYTNNGKSDWFLPSGNELNELYKSKDTVGNMGTVRYWSSSQYLTNTALHKDFYNGSQGVSNKYDECRVRAVRAF